MARPAKDTRMNPRHAAALALVGWYLMVPFPDHDAPLAHWPHNDSFDSAKECREAGVGLQERAAKNRSLTKAQIDARTMWECIASDDPRLKETK